MSHKKQDVQIAVIGAGLAGISTAIALKDKLKFTNFTVYEQSTGIGGTWRDNTYPGCACDVPSHWYSLSTELNPDWSKVWSDQPEILSYWQRIVSKHKLGSFIKFNRRVDRLVWDSTRQVYDITITNLHSNTVLNVSAHVVISAIGGFMSPQFPDDLPGTNVFKGDLWHSARWNHNVSLKNKRVAVIGNGCSAAQFVPKIAREPTTEVVNFCRTPSWFVPRAQSVYPGWQRWIFQNIPGALRAYRAFIMSRMDIYYLFLWPKSSWFRASIRKLLISYIKLKAPQKWHDKLIPNYPPGCRRMILDPGYLKCLHNPNVDMNWDGIEAITDTGITTKQGQKYEFDVIILGTGFHILSSPLQLIGNRGQSLMDSWKADGPTAYLGTTIPGFPNFFMLLGPNTATGHASVIFTEEAQINYMIRMVKPIIEGKYKSFEVKQEANDAYNNRLQKGLQETAFSECTSWYRAGDRDGRIYVTYPAPVTKFWWDTLAPKWQDYNISGIRNWSPAGRLVGFMKGLLFL